jgi:hypothetical protein
MRLIRSLIFLAGISKSIKFRVKIRLRKSPGSKEKAKQTKSQPAPTAASGDSPHQLISAAKNKSPSGLAQTGNS